MCADPLCSPTLKDLIRLFIAPRQEEIKMSQTRSSLLTQIDQRWLTVAVAAAGSALAADQAGAAIVYHAPVGGINVASTFAGIYINLETEAAGTNAGTPGWDI